MAVYGLLQGIFLGVAIAAPVGPISLLCIRRTLLQGRVYGLLTGLGAATADVIYGSLAGLGLVSLNEVLVKGHFWIRLLGGVFLLFLGIRTWFRSPAKKEDEATFSTQVFPAGTGWWVYGSALLLTLSNPLTILSFLAFFAGLGETAGFGAALLLVFGVFVGSCLWWLFVSCGVAFCFQRWRMGLSTGHFRHIDRLSGVLLMGFGLIFLGALLKG
jgi:threonine/homoserine/homoserine lactone efflux protein